MYRAHPQPYTLLPPARGAPQAPQAARSAAAGGGQQVRKIKRHFRFRSFATNVEIRYKSRLTRAEPPTKTTEGRADSAPPGAPQAPQAVRSAATGGGQQVREIKRHFRFRGFGTVYQLWYKSTWSGHSRTDEPCAGLRMQQYCAILRDIARYCAILRDIARYCAILRDIRRY